VNLFVDSSGWIGLFAQSDKHHQAAAEAFSALASRAVHLYTSDYIIDETLTYILITYGRSPALQFGDWVLSNSVVDILHVDPSLWEEAWALFQQYEDKIWSFTDCTSFVLMRQRHLYRAFTFDGHFAQAGFQLWPSLPQ
jgi:predicted nucleic acid-binding protein